MLLYHHLLRALAASSRQDSAIERQIFIDVMNNL